MRSAVGIPVVHDGEDVNLASREHLRFCSCQYREFLHGAWMGIWLCVDKRKIVIHLLRRIRRECGGADDQQFGGVVKRGNSRRYIAIWQSACHGSCDVVEFFSATVLGLQNKIGVMLFN